ncbi:MAG: glycerol-3-phosphate dehydrogenase, partial [Acinetobacter sp.]
EQKEFRLVREALLEREVLLKKAPHLIHPMRFIMPHLPYLRPAWLIRSGLFIYDYLAKRETLEGSELVHFNVDSPLKDTIKRGFEYSDCTVDDARLVVVNAIQAHELGAQIRTQTRCISAVQQEGVWCLTLEHQKQHYQIKARTLVNATGAWVTDFIQQQLFQTPKAGIRLVQGSHIIVKRLYPEPHAFILQNDDQRIVFVIPYLDEYSLIGTTDVEFEGDANYVHITEQETAYLIDVINDHFKLQLQPEDVISSFAGVRALYDDASSQASKVTRDYVLAMSKPVADEAPLLSVYGGKLTTYRKLAEAALLQLKRYFPHMKAEWTAEAKLPGAEGFSSVEVLCAELMHEIKGLESQT